VNPFVFAIRRPITSFMVSAGLVAGGVPTLKKAGVDVLPALDKSGAQAALSRVGVGHEKTRQVLSYIGLGAEPTESAEESQEKEQSEGESHKIVVTRPKAKDVVITQPYVCQIHSQRHIEVRAMARGYLEEISVKEGQAVKKGDVLFKVLPVLYKARLDAENAEARLAQLEFNYTKKLAEANLPVVSKNEVALLEAKLAKAQAKAGLAKAEFDFTLVRAPFDGIVDRLHQQLGSLVEEGHILTTLSDNSLMWVYFNVPEADYLEYMAGRGSDASGERIELVLANGENFQEAGRIGAIEAKFNNETGNIPFRADFPNPNGLLRHGQTGTVLIHRVSRDAVVIPQRAAFEILDKRYVYVVDKDDVVHQREIRIQDELDDIYIIQKGVGVDDAIVLEGVRQVHDGEKVEYELRTPEQVMVSLKNKAE
jgi:membrane fusion protein (multidrug efflux system)